MDKVTVEGKAGVSNVGLKMSNLRTHAHFSHKDLSPNGPRTTSVDFRTECGLVQEEKAEVDHMVQRLCC